MGSEEIKDVMKSTMEEVERVLSTKAVVGEPITLEGTTIIPLLSVCFGFAGGGMGGKKMEHGEGNGIGMGGGGYVRPVGVVIVNKDGARVEPAGSFIAPIAERWIDTFGKILERRFGKPEEGK